PIVALAHDPALLFQRPTTPGTSLDHLKSRHLRHSRMISHTPMSSPPHPSHKAVLSAGIRSLQLAGEHARQPRGGSNGQASSGGNPETTQLDGQSASNQRLVERLEAENAQLRGCVVDLMLQIQALRDGAG